jgi:hypothetical protein
MLVISALKVYPQSQISCQDAGTAVFCSNGLSGIRAGNSMYFSDGSSALASGNTIYFTSGTAPASISPQSVTITPSAAYAAGEALGAAVVGVVGGVASVVQDVRQLGKWQDWCFVNRYSWGEIPAKLEYGRVAFCSEAAILDACSNITSIDYSGYKYASDSPRRITLTAEHELEYWPNLSNGKNVGEPIKCVPDVAGNAVHRAQLWLFYKQEVSSYLPGLSQDDCIRIVNYIYAHPKEYKYIKEDDPNKDHKKTELFKKLYRSAGAAS